MITGADVVAYRQRRNLSRKALALTVGLTEGVVWRIENKNRMSDDERNALIAAGVIPMMQVTSGDFTPPPPPPPPTVLITSNEKPDNFIELVPIVEEVDFAALSRRAEAPFTRFVSNSELQTFKRCRRKWWLAWLRGLRLAHESPVGVRAIGDRLHRALKFHYSPSGPIDLLAALEALIVLDRAKLEQIPHVNDDMRAKFEKEADLERIMLEGYLQWVGDTGADAELEIIASEEYVEAGLSEFDDKVAIIGKLDVRVRRKSDGTHLFIDHKSVANFREPALTLTMNEQMMHYHLLEQLTLAEGGQRSDGALYNMLRRVKRTGTAIPPFYERLEVRHNPHTLTNYRRRVTGEITDMLEVESQLAAGADHHVVAYPRPHRDCTWDCDFLAVCTMFDDGSRVEAMLEQHFVQGDPLDYYRTEVLGVKE